MIDAERIELKYAVLLATHIHFSDPGGAPKTEQISSPAAGLGCKHQALFKSKSGDRLDQVS